ncbi:MAG: peptide-methionine (S)-S-oxide reductase [Lachnospiraceae bacterium]|nr:peptide-methionine (S)-S-oxide reductase [Lachnospiraceae bacterium]
MRKASGRYKSLAHQRLFTVDRQGNDRGIQYRTGIYFTETQQLRKIRPVFPGHYTAGSYHRQSRISPLLTSSKRWLLI